jgi:hypothetical protein
MAALPDPEHTMPRNPQTFLGPLISTVLVTLLLVMSVAFISIPLSLGGHPGEAADSAPRAAFHPT